MPDPPRIQPQMAEIVDDDWSNFVDIEGLTGVFKGVSIYTPNEVKYPEKIDLSSKTPQILGPKDQQQDKPHSRQLKRIKSHSSVAEELHQGKASPCSVADAIDDMKRGKGCVVDQPITLPLTRREASPKNLHTPTQTPWIEHHISKHGKR